MMGRLTRAQSPGGALADAATPSQPQVAGMSLRELRQTLYDQLFHVLLPFWDQHGIDHQYGGIMCSLDYDGTLAQHGEEPVVSGPRHLGLQFPV